MSYLTTTVTLAKTKKLLRWSAVAIFAAGLTACAVPGGKGGAGGAGGYGSDGAGGAYANGLGDDASFGSLATREGLEQYRTVYFSYDNDEIKPWGLEPVNANRAHNENPVPTANKVIHAYARYLLKNPQAHLRIEGNTDARGSREYNIALGERRANAVASALEADGVAADQINVVSYGKEKPIALGTSEDAYCQNRRVNFVIG